MERERQYRPLTYCVTQASTTLSSLGFIKSLWREGVTDCLPLFKVTLVG